MASKPVFETAGGNASTASTTSSVGIEATDSETSVTTSEDGVEVACSSIAFSAPVTSGSGYRLVDEMINITPLMIMSRKVHAVSAYTPPSGILISAHAKNAFQQP
jgi:hypothetical protein